MLFCLVGILLISFITTIVCIKQHTLLNLYKTGFHIEGTYQNSSDEYIIFEKNQTEFYKYKQFKNTTQFQLKKSEHPNLYLVENSSNEFIIFEKDCLYFIQNGSTDKYTKISNISVFINTNK